tara:strand:+ start:1353 stop:2009 length:657 start_codon:yes stop_codon:yes gene_type:complete
LDEVSNYWINFKPKNIKESCPNLSLFRFLGAILESFEDKRILEVGFNNGVDLLECKKRGAHIYGTDINPNALKSIDIKDRNNLKISKSGKEPLPFNIQFDLIYTRDTLCYFTVEEIKFFINDAKRKLKSDGILLIHFIEKDLFLESANPIDDVNFNLFKNGTFKSIHPENPFRFITSYELINSAKEVNLNLFASKRMIQSYDLKEEQFRVERYLAFKG